MSTPSSPTTTNMAYLVDGLPGPDEEGLDREVATFLQLAIELGELERVKLGHVLVRGRGAWERLLLQLLLPLLLILGLTREDTTPTPTPSPTPTSTR